VANDLVADVHTVAAEAVEVQERRRHLELSRLAMMRGYAEGQNCRRAYLLTYFGEEVGQACGCCDLCERGLTVEAPEPQGPFPLNSWGQHTEWGRGLVTRYEGEKVIVVFETVGEKRLAVDCVLAHSLLTPLAS